MPGILEENSSTADHGLGTDNLRLWRHDSEKPVSPEPPDVVDLSSPPSSPLACVPHVEKKVFCFNRLKKIYFS